MAALLAVAALAGPACSAAGPPGNGAVTVDAGDLASGIAVPGVAVRVRGEDERNTLRIAALANDALRRGGIWPDETAPLTLYLTFTRPHVVTERDRPDVSVLGRGGSSSKAEFGLAIELPFGDGPAPSPPVPHVLIATLESGGGETVWHAKATTDAVPGSGERAALRRLVEAVAKALVKAKGKS